MDDVREALARGDGLKQVDSVGRPAGKENVMVGDGGLLGRPVDADGVGYGGLVGRRVDRDSRNGKVLSNRFVYKFCACTNQLTICEFE